MSTGKPLTDELKNEIIKLYTSGELRNKHKLADKFGISKKRIDRLFEENNIESECSGFFKIFSDEQISEIIRLYKIELLGKEKIGEIFKSSKRTIARVLKENNVETNTTKPTLEQSNEVVDIFTKYTPTDEYTYIAIHKESGYKTYDYYNKRGFIEKYMLNNYPECELIPSKKRKLHFITIGDYWFEKYFSVVKVPHPFKYEKLESKKFNLSDSDVYEMVRLYSEGEIKNLDDLSKIFKVEKLNIKKVLSKYCKNTENDENILIKKRIRDRKNLLTLPIKYKQEDGCIYRAVDKKDGTMLEDFNNISGKLTYYINTKYGKDFNTLTKTQKFKYFKQTGNYWYEEYFDIIKFKDKAEEAGFKKCKCCDEYIDVLTSNKKMRDHLLNDHKINIINYVEEFPEDLELFSRDVFIINKNKRDAERLSDPNNWIECKICGGKFGYIGHNHLKTHGVTVPEYKNMYGEIMSETYRKYITQTMIDYNASGVMKTYISRPEKELQEFLDSIDVKHESNRSILIGKEIDLLIEDKKIGIEYNGNKWHTEWFGGKDSNYHLDKTILCNEKGYNLIHIFDDEYFYKKDIVLNKLKHILGKNTDLLKIGARKCVIESIDVETRRHFLDEFHIQGDCPANVNLGAFYDNKLIAVMSFKELIKESKEYDLVRFASDYNYILQGVGSKILNYFIKNYNPLSIISFADRRWTLNGENNLYTKMGFNLSEILKPDYRYYNSKVDKYARIHKFNFRKQILSKKYGFDLSMTETEMARELEYDRIWDCGLFKYEMRFGDKNEIKKTSISVYSDEDLNFVKSRIEPKGRKVKVFDKETIDEMIRLYTSGELQSKDKIAKKFGTDKRKIRQIFNENNVEGVCSGFFKTFGDEETKEIIRLYKEEKIAKEKIGEIFKTSKRIIANVLKDNNIENN